MPLLHQITLGSKVPRLNRECLESWHTLESRGFEIVTWNDRRAADYVASCPLPEFSRLYRMARNHGEASDLLRMAVAHSYGGLYVDWDVLLVDADRFLEIMPDFEQSACVLIEDPRSTDRDAPRVYDNSLFYLRKGHPLAIDFLHHVARNYQSAPLPTTPFLSGPLALTRFLDTHPDHRRDCRVVDMLAVYALDYEDVIRETQDRPERRHTLRHRCSASHAPAIHFWSHTWAPRPSWSARVRQRLSRVARRRPAP